MEESDAHPISGAEMGSENQQRAATVSSASQEKFLVESDEESTWCNCMSKKLFRHFVWLQCYNFIMATAVL